MDEVDVRENYGNKLEQVKSIVESVPTCIHTDRKVQVWHDRDLSCTNESNAEVRNVRKRVLEREQEV